MKQYEQNDHGWNGGTAFLREFGKTTIPALQGYVDRMARTGDIGSWMRALQPCYQTQIAGQKVLFMHADLHETFRDRAHLERYLEEMNEWRKVSSADAGGTRKRWGRLATFVWDRSYTEPSPIRQSAVDKLCRDVGVDYIVTGHTPHPSVEGIKIHGGKIFDIDVGMIRGNMPQALVLSRRGILAFRADGQQRLFVRFKSTPSR